MRNSIVGAAIVGFASLIPSVMFSETAIPVSDCAFMQSYGPDKYYENHKDIGAGFVTYTERFEFGTIIIVANCISGSTLKIDHSGQEPRVGQKYVLAAATSQEKVTLSALREHFSSLGLWTSLKVQTTEHCACAAFYPDAKGKKGDWQQRYEHP